MNKDKEPILGLGELIAENFTGDAWFNPLSSIKDNDCSIYNVTFAPRTRNYWHTHSVGQVLLCTDGVGYYQEKGKNAVKLNVGDVINIPANTLHWHGASPNSRFTHIGITPKMSENVVKWDRPVYDEEYNKAVSL